MFVAIVEIVLKDEKKDDFKKGAYYFNKCLSISDFDYERGIHQQARVALDRISN